MELCRAGTATDDVALHHGQSGFRSSDRTYATLFKDEKSKVKFIDEFLPVGTTSSGYLKSTPAIDALLLERWDRLRNTRFNSPAGTHGK